MRHRTQIAALPGGTWIVEAIEDILATQHIAPFRIGAITVHTGTGTPEGAIVANVGDLYLRTDGGTSTTLYVKTASGGSNTGWTAK